MVHNSPCNKHKTTSISWTRILAGRCTGLFVQVSNRRRFRTQAIAFFLGEPTRGENTTEEKNPKRHKYRDFVMLVQLPRLTSSLREPFDIDQAYLRRKTILQTLNKPRRSVFFFPNWFHSFTKFSASSIASVWCYIEFDSCIVWWSQCLSRIWKAFGNTWIELDYCVTCVCHFSSGNRLDESDLAKRIVHQWEGGDFMMISIFSQFLYKRWCCVYIDWNWCDSFSRSATSIQAVYWSCSGIDWSGSSIRWVSRGCFFRLSSV